MNTEVTVALISAGVAVCSAAVSAYATARSIRLQHELTLRRGQLDRQAASEDLVRRYRSPLLLSAFDLHARIYNIVQDGFFARHLASADPQEQQYARVSTLYRVGDFFGWTEILRRDLQFLDLGDDNRTRELAGRLTDVSFMFSDTTARYRAGLFHLFRDEQRAIGELMLEPAVDDLRRYQCMGFATFTSRLEKDPEFARWFKRLSCEADALANPPAGQMDRLIGIQHALIELILFLDPDGLRFPKARLDLLPPPPGAVTSESQEQALPDRGPRKLTEPEPGHMTGRNALPGKASDRRHCRYRLRRLWPYAPCTECPFLYVARRL